MTSEHRDADRIEGGRRPLLIGGITPFSTVDWPGKLACVAFLAGCPWRCPYCQNHILQSFSAAQQSEADLFAFLDERRGLLDGVVFSGGEPLAQQAVVEAAAQAKAMGFEVGLHTCGGYPERLQQMLPYLDWVGVDIKAPWGSYDRITRVAGSAEPVRQSLEVLLGAHIPFETRTTWHPSLLSPTDIATIADELASRGVRSWAIQAYRHTGTTGELADETVYPSDAPEALDELFEHFEFRRA